MMRGRRLGSRRRMGPITWAWSQRSRRDVGRAFSLAGLLVRRSQIKRKSKEENTRRTAIHGRVHGEADQVGRTESGIEATAVKNAPKAKKAAKEPKAKVARKA